MRLIAALDVGWERDTAEAIGHGGDGFTSGSGETDDRRAILRFGDNRTGEGAIGGCERGADGKLFARFDETVPNVLVLRSAQQEALDRAAGRPLGMEARGQDGGIVAKKRVAGAQELRQIGERMVGEGVGGAIDHQQARLIATRSRHLRDQARREIVIEKIGGEGHVFRTWRLFVSAQSAGNVEYDCRLPVFSGQRALSSRMAAVSSRAGHYALLSVR